MGTQPLGLGPVEPQSTVMTNLPLGWGNGANGFSLRLSTPGDRFGAAPWASVSVTPPGQTTVEVRITVDVVRDADGNLTMSVGTILSDGNGNNWPSPGRPSDVFLTDLQRAR